MARDAVARFWEKVDTQGPVWPVGGSSCWMWKAVKKADGYGVFTPKTGTKVLAHRFSYELVYGPITPGMQLDHLCRTRECVNPLHLEAVTSRENTLRGTGVSATHARRTHCGNGHEFNETNTYIYPSGKRKCRACKRVIDARLRAERRTPQSASSGGAS